MDDRPLRIIRSGPEGVFGARSNGDAKEDDGAKAFVDERRQVGDDFVDAATVLVGEGRD